MFHVSQWGLNATHVLKTDFEFKYTKLYKLISIFGLHYQTHMLVYINYSE